MGETGLDGSSVERAPVGADPRTASVRYRREALRIADARHFATEYLARSQRGRRTPLPESASEAVHLVVSELITNSVKYGADPIELTLSLADDTVTVTVRDGDTTLPAPKPADPARVGQHGLEIVAALSQAIDVRREPSGKRITARIALD
ncbi:ATP-binding protein [Streptomyces sp. NPDC057148]|uniref:ATP-binding protein n=1 Tax=unclassified Streptomyces TaxID=2593676 RepID=UPI0036360425